jgi:hypothetical protein
MLCVDRMDPPEGKPRAVVLLDPGLPTITGTQDQAVIADHPAGASVDEPCRLEEGIGTGLATRSQPPRLTGIVAREDGPVVGDGPDGTFPEGPDDFQVQVHAVLVFPPRSPAVGSGQDRAAGADGPAGRSIGEIDRRDAQVRAGGRLEPGLAAVDGMEDGPLFAGGPADRRVYEVKGVKLLARPAVLVDP